MPLASCYVGYCKLTVDVAVLTLLQEVELGIVADLGTLQRLPKTVGNDSLVRELCYTARQMNASEALSVGLVRFVVVFICYICNFENSEHSN